MLNFHFRVVEIFQLTVYHITNRKLLINQSKFNKMKKISSFFLVALLSLFSMTAKAGDYGNGDLMTIINNATAGEVINLTGTAYTYSAAATLDKSLTIQAGPAVTARPVITIGFTSYFFTASSATEQTLSLKGLEFDGNLKSLGLTSASTTVKLTVTVDNCKASNFATTSWSKMFNYGACAAGATNGDLTVSNSEFVGPNPKSIILAGGGTTITPNNISFTNCYFNGLNTTNTTITVSTTYQASITIDHCTFRNCSSGTKQVFSLPISGFVSLLKNNIFVDITGTGNNTTATNANNSKNVVFNSGDATTSKWYKLASSSTGATTTATNPILILDPALNLTTGITTLASYIDAGTDGKTIGYYGAPAFAVATVPGTPTITAITAGDTQLSVAFTAGTDGGSAITTYEYSTDGGANWANRQTGTTASPIVITGLTNGTSYDVQIRAKNTVGSGAATATTAATPVAPATVPGVPTITSVDAGGNVNFTAPVSDGGSAITGYIVKTYEVGNATAVGTATMELATTIKAIALVKNHDYQFTVTAHNAIGDGIESALSSTVTASGTTAINSSSAANTFTVAQSGANFTVNGIADAAYTVYSVSGSQVAIGVLKAGNFKLNANKGIYLLKVNVQVAKFSVR
jgi:hypothetical protein